MVVPLASPPKSICLLRLSALGDVSHVLPMLRTLQAHWPQTAITWIIGKTEYGLVGDLPGVDFIIFDKAKGVAAYRELRRALQGRRFDVLLHMQAALRASLASLLVRADLRIGFDRARAKDMQWLFTNCTIAARPREHVLESFFGFVEVLGVSERLLCWDIPIPETAAGFAAEQLPADGRCTLVISPCSSMAYRDWSSSGYAAVAIHAIRQHGMKVVLCGGKSRREWLMGAEIMGRLDCEGCAGSVNNLIGSTSLKQLLAVLARADVVLAPDAGPAHLATAVGTPVIGLYACTNPDRARPYLSAGSVVNRYPEAVLAKYGKPVAELPWGIRVKEPGTMLRITAEEVCTMLDKVLAATTQPMNP
ncbi:MAG TPA: glycosyltransferase family 9 protein [Gammaproteobacteria bacterium]